MTRRGELLRMHRGVYALGHRSPAPEARWAAALLAAGRESVLSHTTVLAVHGLLAPRDVTEVTSPTQRRGDRRLRVHRAPTAGEITRVRGMRVTTLARTFLDLAAADWPIHRHVHDAAASGRTSLAALRAYAIAAEGRRGVMALRRALALPHTRSPGEARLLAAILAAGLPAPEMNAPIGRMTVDAYYERLGLVIELDHEETHGSAYAIARDARRDAALGRRGLEVRRVRERDVPALLAELRARL